MKNLNDIKRENPGATNKAFFKHYLEECISEFQYFIDRPDMDLEGAVYYVGDIGSNINIAMEKLARKIQRENK